MPNHVVVFFARCVRKLYYYSQGLIQDFLLGGGGRSNCMGGRSNCKGSASVRKHGHTRVSVRGT